MAKEFLSSNNAAYEELDLTKNPDALTEMVEIAGVRTVPVITGCGEVIIGFDKEKLTSLINCINK